MIQRFLLVNLLALAFAIGVFGQQMNTDLQKGEMKKVDSMVGQWNGAGWMQQGSTRSTFTGTETVQRKLGGLALLIEGNFKNPEGRVIHETLALLSFDANASKYRFQTHLATGASGDYDFRTRENGFEWGFQTPSGTIRYTISTIRDVWLEIGEFSRDGKSWIKFFEMKLERAK